MTTHRSFRRLYPNRESIVFDGGLDTKFEKALLPDNESPDCLNVIFDNGSVGTREGIVKVNTALVASAAFDGLYTRRANDGTETMVAFCNGSMFTLATTTFITVPSAQSVFVVGNRVACDTAENYLFIGQSGTSAYKWDGTNFTLHGVQAPTATATVASNGVGALTASGQYQYKVTYVNSALVEGNLGPASTTFVISTTSGQNTVSNIPTAAASFGVARRKVYRNASADTATFKLVTTLSDNTTTTYNDNVADSALGATAPTDNGVPPQYTAIIYHRGILFMNDTANPNYVWYATANQPYTVPSTQFFRVGDKTSDLVRGFGVYDNHLIILCDQSIWINYMADPATPSGWRQLRTNSPYGSRSPFCVMPAQVGGLNVVLFAANQKQVFTGFGALSGLALDPTSTLLTVTAAGADLQSQRIEPDMFSVNTSSAPGISGIVYKNKAYITVPYGSSQTTNNRVYVFDFSISNLKKSQAASWVPFTGMNIAQMTVYNGLLYGASSTTNGFVYKLLGTSVYTDDGAAINSYYWTKEFSGFEPDTNFHKDFRYVNLLVDNAGAYYMNMLYRIDSDKGSGQAVQININPGGTVWGTTMIWGTSVWGGGANQAENRIYLGPLLGRRLQLQFSNQNTASQRFKVHRCNFAYNLRGYR